jgi:hypothetical protein
LYRIPPGGPEGGFFPAAADLGVAFFGDATFFLFAMRALLFDDDAIAGHVAGHGGGNAFRSALATAIPI